MQMTGAQADQSTVSLRFPGTTDTVCNRMNPVDARLNNMTFFNARFKVSRLLTVTAAVLLVTVVACSTNAREPAIPSGAGIHSWYENGTGGHYVAPVIEGSAQLLASGSRIGLVLTDTHCTPDAQGLSHCHNSIEFSDGSRITITDNHQMSRHRCLRPGERVRVMLFKGQWVTLQTGI